MSRSRRPGSREGPRKRTPPPDKTEYLLAAYRRALREGKDLDRKELQRRIRTLSSLPRR